MYKIHTFKEVNWFGDEYSIDTNGVIYNDTRGCLLKGYKRGNGYLSVDLFGKNQQIHRLVATTFCDKRPEANEVNHKDGNKTNNCADNLEWVTRQENQDHAMRTGLWKPHMGLPKGTEHPSCVLTEEEVHRICKRIAMGKGFSRKVFPPHITYNMYRNIKKRSAWKHISKDYAW